MPPFYDGSFLDVKKCAGAAPVARLLHSNRGMRGDQTLTRLAEKKEAWLVPTMLTFASLVENA